MEGWVTIMRRATMLVNIGTSIACVVLSVLNGGASAPLLTLLSCTAAGQAIVTFLRERGEAEELRRIATTALELAEEKVRGDKAHPENRIGFHVIAAPIKEAKPKRAPNE